MDTALDKQDIFIPYSTRENMPAFQIEASNKITVFTFIPIIESPGKDFESNTITLSISVMRFHVILLEILLKHWE